MKETTTQTRGDAGATTSSVAYRRKRGDAGHDRISFSGEAATIYVKASLNNTIVTATDHRGRALGWSSGGKVGYKGARKSTPHAAQKAGEEVGKKLIEKSIRRAEVLFCGFGPGRESVLPALRSEGVEIVAMGDRTPVVHNGCRPPKEPRG